jgi:hypothetical protein
MEIGITFFTQIEIALRASKILGPVSNCFAATIAGVANILIGL